MTTLETDGALNLGGSNGGNGGLMNGDGIWAFLLFALIFRNGNGGIFGGQGQGGAMDGYVLVSDFATIERKLDSLANGICDSTFALNNSINNGFFGVQNALCQGFNGINMGIADCCCKTQRGLDSVNYNLATQANMLSRGIENGFAQTNYNLATQNCATLQAIDKVGDRVIDYLTQGELRKYRDDALVARFRQEVNPCAIPAYPVPNPNCCYPANVTFGNPYGNCNSCC